MIVLNAIRWLISLILNPVSIALFLLLATAIYLRIRKLYRYWPERGVCGPTPTFPWGTEKGSLWTAPLGTLSAWIYHTQGGKQYCGYIDFLTKNLLVGDPDLIQAITVKSFDHFTDRQDLTFSEKFELMVSELHGEEWKLTRRLLTPTFSASKLRGMHQICLENTDNLLQHIRLSACREEEVDTRALFKSFTMDNIASCAFGLTINSYSDKENIFAKNAAIFSQMPSGYKLFRVLAFQIFPKKLIFQLPDPYVEVYNFFKNIIQETIEHRTRDPSKARPDFLNLLLETKDESGKRLLSDDHILSQAVLFFIAGLETTANLLMYATYCLAENMECQEKAQKEINRVFAKYDSSLPYEAMADLEYLSQVLDETLRLYPPLPELDRVCNREYTIPDERGVVIEPGTVLTFPVLALHRDPDLYPQPMSFIPERFAAQADASMKHPKAPYLAFGVGPRQCLARRFSLYVAKMVLANVIRQFSVHRSSNTPSDPIEFGNESFTLAPAQGTLHLTFRLRDKWSSEKSP